MPRFNLKAWMQEHQDIHPCACGCGETIRILPEHHTRGIPKFINGHGSRIRNAMRGRRGARNPNYKGGRFINSDGYVCVLNPQRTGHTDRYVYEHRLIMERHLGRALESHEQIHHRDGNKTNNSVANLELMATSDHTVLHQRLLRRKVGEDRYLRAKRRIHRGLPYRELLQCSQS